MKQISFIFLAITFLLSVTSAKATPGTDLTGIYQSVDGGGDFLTINRNNEQYILVNISRNLGLLHKLGLITEQEFNESSVNPPVEEFAFTFTIEESDLFSLAVGMQLRMNLIPEIIIPFPARTSSLKALPYPLVSITTYTSDSLGASSTRDVAPYCLISLDISAVG